MSGRRGFQSWAPPGSPIARTPASRDPQATLYVFCEGEKTEIGWLNWLQRAARHLNLQVIGSGGVGVPATVVAKAIEKRRTLEAELRKAPETELDEVWVVIDRDDHDLSTALLHASKAGVGIVFSNACFELWPLLHLEEVSCFRDRRWLQARLKQLHPNYDHDHGAQVDWGALGGADEATRRALLLHLRAPDPTTWTAGRGRPDHPRGVITNPSTSAWLLHRRCVQGALGADPFPDPALRTAELADALARLIARSARAERPPGRGRSAR